MRRIPLATQSSSRLADDARDVERHGNYASLPGQQASRGSVALHAEYCKIHRESTIAEGAVILTESALFTNRLRARPQ